MKFRKSLIFTIAMIVCLVQFIPNGNQINNSPSAQADNSLNLNAIYHNTRDGYYRSPGFGTTSGYNKTGAIPTGTAAILRLRTQENDATEVKIITSGKSPLFNLNVTMQIYETKDGFDYWEGIFPVLNDPNECTYLFEIKERLR